MSGTDPDGVVYGPLTAEDATGCAGLERILFAGDGPWSAAAFLSEIGSRHTTCVAARAGERLVGYAVLAALGRGEEVDPSAYYFRTVVSVESSAPALATLQHSLFVAVAERAATRVSYATYRFA